MKLTRRGAACLGLGAAIQVFGSRFAYAQSAVERVKGSGVLNVATEAQYPPFDFVREGKIVGYNSELLAEVVKQLNVKLALNDLPFQGILPGLIARKFDLVASAIGMTTERASRYAFTMPVGISQAYILKRATDNSIKTAADLNGKIVATQLASSVEPVVKELDQKLKDNGGSGFREIKLFPAFADTFLAVGSRTVDASIANLPLVQALLRDRPGVFELVEPATEKKTYLGWATHPDDVALRDFVNDVFKAMKADGRMAAAQERWFGMTLELPDRDYLPNGAI